MSWEVILKRKKRKFNRTVLRTVIEEIISDMDKFVTSDILDEVKEKYANAMIPTLGLGNAKNHAKRLSTGIVGTIVGAIGTHKVKRENIFNKEGKITGTEAVYRRVEE